MKNQFGLLLTAGMCALAPAAWGQRAAVGAAEVNGTFRDQEGCEFKVLALGGGKLRVSYRGIHYFPSSAGRMANTGEADGIAWIQADSAIFRPDDLEAEEPCRMVLRFQKPGLVTVRQYGNGCGFGVGVPADGHYIKISSRKPRFDTESPAQR